MVYEVTLSGPPLSKPFTDLQQEALRLVLTNLGNGDSFHRQTSDAAKHLRKLPYFPRALWSAQSLCLTLYDLLQAETGGLIEGVTVTTSGGRPYPDPKATQPSDEEQPHPHRYWLDQSGSYTAEPQTAEAEP